VWCVWSVCVLQEVAVEEEEGEVVMVSTAPEELRMQVLTQRSAAAPSRNSSLLATAGLNLPSRALVSGLVGSVSPVAWRVLAQGGQHTLAVQDISGHVCRLYLLQTAWLGML